MHHRLYVPLLLLLVLVTARLAPAQTGPDVAAFEPLDEEIEALLDTWDVPGLSIAVMFRGRLLFARGYGLADVEASEPVQPYSIFRIGSNSKPVTAVAILKLVEEGRLDLDASVFGDVLTDLEPLPGQTPDPRLYDITVRDLLHHAGGWDRAAFGGEPIQMTRQIAQWAGVEAPAAPETIIRYMMGQPLTFDPGTRYSYTGLSYSILGRIIEHVTGQAYEPAVQDLILREAGSYRMRVGRTLREDAYPDEVTYYDYPGATLATNVFTGAPASVSWPYGGIYIEALDASGAWTASVLDLARFLAAVDGYAGLPDVLAPATLETMVAPPPPPIAEAGAQNYYAMGWAVWHGTNGQKGWGHEGALPGTRSFMTRYPNGLEIVALTNSLPQDGQAFATAYYQAINQAFARVGPYPAHDLFLPQLAQPTGDEVTTTSAKLAWAFVDQAEGFEVQVAEDAGFSNLVDERETGDATAALTALDPSTTYHWRVRALRGGLPDAWSEVASFTTLALPNTAPVAGAALPDTTLLVGGAPLTQDLDLVFSDPDGDLLTFTAESSEESVAEASVAGSVLTITARSTGQATVSVTADDGNGGTAQVAFVVSVPTGVAAEPATEGVPQAFALEVAYPNPFNPSTTIRYALSTASEVRLAVYDVLGREVAVLLDGRQAAGRHAVVWEAGSLPSGVYFYRIEAGQFSQARRVTLLK